MRARVRGTSRLLCRCVVATRRRRLVLDSDSDRVFDDLRAPCRHKAFVYYDGCGEPSSATDGGGTTVSARPVPAGASTAPRCTAAAALVLPAAKTDGGAACTAAACNRWHLLLRQWLSDLHIHQQRHVHARLRFMYAHGAGRGGRRRRRRRQQHPNSWRRRRGRGAGGHLCGHFDFLVCRDSWRWRSGLDNWHGQQRRRLVVRGLGQLCRRWRWFFRRQRRDDAWERRLRRRSVAQPGQIWRHGRGWIRKKRRR